MKRKYYLRSLLALFASLVLISCSVTVGTVNINDDGKARTNTDIVQEKPVTVNTDADVPISAIP